MPSHQPGGMWHCFWGCKWRRCFGLWWSMPNTNILERSRKRGLSERIWETNRNLPQEWRGLLTSRGKFSIITLLLLVKSFDSWPDSIASNKDFSNQTINVKIESIRELVHDYVLCLGTFATVFKCYVTFQSWTQRSSQIVFFFQWVRNSNWLRYKQFPSR